MSSPALGWPGHTDEETPSEEACRWMREHPEEMARSIAGHVTTQCDVNMRLGDDGPRLYAHMEGPGHWILDTKPQGDTNA